MDLFNPQLTQIYVSAVGGPKDIVLLIDRCDTFHPTTGLMLLRMLPSPWRTPRATITFLHPRARPYWTRTKRQAQPAHPFVYPISQMLSLPLSHRSGSNDGQGLALSILSASTLLDTLSENDFVAILTFSEDVTILGCFDVRTQNKRAGEKSPHSEAGPGPRVAAHCGTSLSRAQHCLQTAIKGGHVAGLCAFGGFLV